MVVYCPRSPNIGNYNHKVLRISFKDKNWYMTLSGYGEDWFKWKKLLTGENSLSSFSFTSEPFLVSQDQRVPEMWKEPWEQWHSWCWQCECNNGYLMIWLSFDSELYIHDSCNVLTGGKRCLQSRWRLWSTQLWASWNCKVDTCDIECSPISYMYFLQERVSYEFFFIQANSFKLD